MALNNNNMKKLLLIIAVVIVGCNSETIQREKNSGCDFQFNNSYYTILKHEVTGKYILMRTDSTSMHYEPYKFMHNHGYDIIDFWATRWRQPTLYDDTCQLKHDFLIYAKSEMELNLNNVNNFKPINHK